MVGSDWPVAALVIVSNRPKADRQPVSRSLPEVAPHERTLSAKNGRSHKNLATDHRQRIRLHG